MHDDADPQAVSVVVEERPMVAWIVLVISGVFETVWAAALAQSKGFTRLVPSLIFGGALLVSMAGLAFALRTIPVGTGYAIWVGIGAIGTVVYGIVALGEPASIGRLLCVALIVAGVVGLKLLH
jgi:quaternary ammonium compound-resistance protein SugE